MPIGSCNNEQMLICINGYSLSSLVKDRTGMLKCSNQCLLSRVYDCLCKYIGHGLLMINVFTDSCIFHAQVIIKLDV